MRLKLEKHIDPRKLVARMGNERATLVFHICNGRLVYGFDIENPPPALEARLAGTNDKRLAALYGRLA